MSQFKFTEAAEKVIGAAQSLARDNSNISITPAHLASALLDDSTDSSTAKSTPSTNAPASSLFASVLDKAGADVTAVRRGVQRIVVRLPSQDPPPEDLSFSGPAMRVLRDAQKASSAAGDTFIGTIHLIIPLFNDPQLATVFKEAGATAEAVGQALNAVKAGKRVDSKQAEEGFEALSKYAINLTALASEGKLDPCIGRDDEVRRVIRILSRRTKNNPILIGEPGTGKTAIVEGLAQRIVNRDVPVNLLGQLWSLDVGALMAGASYKGQYEERVKSVIDECERSSNVVLFIDEIHLIMAGQGGNSGMDAANLLKPALARGKLRTIGATTLAEYRKYIEKDQALVRRFQEVLVNEPSVPSAISILRGVREKYELHHGVSISDPAIVQAATLAHRYLTSRKLPDSALDLIDEACAAVRVARDSQPEIIDKLERQKTQLEIEIHALEKEGERIEDANTAERLEAARAELRKVGDELAPLKAEYEAIKSRTDEINRVRERIDELKSKADQAERAYDLATAADIRYGAVPSLQERLSTLEAKKKAEDKGSVLGEEEVTPDAIAEIVARWTGIPANSLKQSEKEKLLRMEKLLAKEVVGQPEALKSIANAIRLSRSGLANEGRPTGSFLFCGPSGTGKTQTVKALAKYLFNDDSCICRIDCSEYSEKHAVSRLIGAAPGYIGYEEGGQLTEFVRRKPYSIVLFDEIEKAAKELTTLLLQVLDDGRLTDSQGRVVNFRQCIIVLTSNLGSQYLNELPADSSVTPEVKELVHGAIRGHFAPEFINRLDSIVIFNPLGRKQVSSIVDIRLAEVQRRLHTNGRKITIDVDAAAKSWLADNGFHPAYGARPLNRTIQQELLNPLSRYLIEERIRDNETAHVTVDLKANRLVIEPNHASTVVSDEMDVDGDDIDIDDVRVEELD